MGVTASEDPDGALLQMTKSMVKSLLVAAPRGMPAREVNMEYKDLEGSWLPYAQLKYQSVDALLQSMTDILWFIYDSQQGCTVYNVKEVEEDAHVRKLVVGQKKISTKAKLRKRASAFATRGRGGYRGRGRGRGRGWGGASNYIPCRAPLLPSPSPFSPWQPGPYIPRTVPQSLPRTNTVSSSQAVSSNTATKRSNTTRKPSKSEKYAEMYNSWLNQGTKSQVPNTDSLSSSSKVNYNTSVPRIPSALKVYKDTSNIYSNRYSNTKNNSVGSRPQSPIPSHVKTNIIKVLQSQRGWIFVDHFCSLYEQKFNIRADFRSLGYNNINEVLDILADVVERQVDQKGNIYIRYVQTAKKEQESCELNKVSKAQMNTSSQVGRYSAFQMNQKPSPTMGASKNFSAQMVKSFPAPKNVSSHTVNQSPTQEKQTPSTVSEASSSASDQSARYYAVQTKQKICRGIRLLAKDYPDGMRLELLRPLYKKRMLEDLNVSILGYTDILEFVLAHKCIFKLNRAGNGDIYITPVKGFENQEIIVEKYDISPSSTCKNFKQENGPHSISPIAIVSPHTVKSISPVTSQCSEISRISPQNRELLSPILFPGDIKPPQTNEVLKPTPIKLPRSKFSFVKQEKSDQYGNSANGFPSYPPHNLNGMPSVTTDLQHLSHIKMESKIESKKTEIIGSGEIYQQMDIVSAQLQECDGWLQVYCAQVYTPTQFYVQIRKNKQQLTELMDKMMIFYYYEKNMDSYRLLEEDCVEGMPVVSLYEEDQNVYRGIIRRVDNRDSVQVFYVDYGVHTVVQSSELWYLHRKFFSLPMMAFQARLSGISPASPRNQWDRMASELFAEMVYSKPLFAKIKGVENSAWSLFLVDTTGEADVNISDQLVKEGQAIPDGQDEPLPVIDSSFDTAHNISNASINSYKQEQSQIYEDVLKNVEMDTLYENQKLQEQYMREELLRKQASKSQQNLLTVCQQIVEQKQQLVQEKKKLQEREDKVICQELLQHQKKISKQKIEQDLSLDFSCLNVTNTQDQHVNSLQEERFLQEQKKQQSQSHNLLTQQGQDTHKYNQDNLKVNVNLHQKRESNNDENFKKLVETNQILRKHLERTVQAIYQRKELNKITNSSTRNAVDGIVGGTNNEIKKQVSHTQMHNRNDSPFTLEQLMLIKEAQSQQNKLAENGFHMSAMSTTPLSPSYEASCNRPTNEAPLNKEKIVYIIESLEKKRNESVLQLVTNPDSDDLILSIKQLNAKINEAKKLLGRFNEAKKLLEK